MDTLFANCTVLTMDASLTVYYNAYVGVTDGKISFLGKSAPQAQPGKIIDCTGMILMPGLINCHAHLPHTLLRGLCDEKTEAQMLDQVILPRQARFDHEAVRLAATLGIAEALRFGTTSISDLSCREDAVAEAAAQAGIKCNLAEAATVFTESFDMDRDPAGDALQTFAARWHNHDGGRIKVDAGLESEYTTNYALWDAFGEYAGNCGHGMQLHLSATQASHASCLERTGLTPAQLLDCHHVFDVPATAAGCGYLEDADMALLARRHVTAVHCPVSAMKLACGGRPVTDMVRAGMNVALGTGSPACNNTLDLFEEMKAAALREKSASGDPAALPPAAVLTMATVCGAKAQGRAQECGQIRPGMDADLILVDFTAPHLIPCHDVISQLVYAARGGDVALTMVRGQVLYAAGKFPTIDLADTVRQLTESVLPRILAEEPAGQAQEKDGVN